MYADITVRKSRLTGHWIVERNLYKEGFRRWVDAMARADELAAPLRESARRMAEAVEREHADLIDQS